MVPDPSLGLLIEGIGLAKSVSELLGLTESIEEKVDLLLESDLKSGMQELQQAANSITEKTSLLRSARNHFNTAVTFESGHRKCLSYIGLATCHFHLRDFPNVCRALDQALEIKSEISTKEWVVAMFNEQVNPKALTNWKWTKKRFKDSYNFRDAFKFRDKFSRGLRQYTKKEAAGPMTEELLEDQRKLLALQEVARTERNRVTKVKS